MSMLLRKQCVTSNTVNCNVLFQHFQTYRIVHNVPGVSTNNQKFLQIGWFRKQLVFGNKTASHGKRQIAKKKKTEKKNPIAKHL